MVIGQQLSKIFKGSRLQWTRNVGALHYRNNIIGFGEFLLASTSGEKWNQPDARDGVFCLSRKTGEEIWRSPCIGDPNSITLWHDVIVGGTDSGHAFALNAHDGAFLAEQRLSSAVLGKPVVLTVAGSEIAILVTMFGEVWGLERSGSRFMLLGEIDGTFRTNLVLCGTSRDAALIGSDDGRIYRLSMRGGRLVPTVIHTLEDRPSIGGGYKLGIRGIGSIVVEGEIAVVSYARKTYDAAPPIVAINAGTGEVLWHGRRVKSVSKNADDYGNARVTPVIVDGLVFSTFSYNDSLHAFSLKDGRGAWKIKLDEGFFQNWASPLLLHDDKLIVPRVNGIVHTVNLRTKAVVDSISVEIGRYMEPDSSTVSNPISQDLSSKVWPSSHLLAGIASTPIIHKGSLIVGGVSGEMRSFSI